jgi:hypothetical protein
VLTPEQLGEYSRWLTPLYNDYQDRLIEDMALRIKKMGVSQASVWQLRAYEDAGRLGEFALKQISKLTGQSKAALRRAFLDAGYKAAEYPRPNTGDTAVSQLSPQARQVLEAGYEKTHGMLNNLTLTTASTSQAAFISAVNGAYLDVAHGGFDVDTALRGAISKAAADGLTVLYPSGAKTSVEAAVRRAVITGINQTAARVALKNMEELGAEYVETSAHLGARPEHCEWQGRVFHVGGATDRYPDFESSTGYGSAEGLCGVNCRHSFYPFLLDASERAYTDAELRAMADAKIVYNGEEIPYYKGTQIQRRLERAIRAAKRERLAMAAVDDDKGVAAAAASLKAAKARLDAFLKETGLTREPSREAVAGTPARLPRPRKSAPRPRLRLARWSVPRVGRWPIISSRGTILRRRR